MGAEASCLSRTPLTVSITTPSTPTSMRMSPTNTSYTAPTHSPLYDFTDTTHSPPQRRPRALIRLTALIKRLTHDNANVHDNDGVLADANYNDALPYSPSQYASPPPPPALSISTQLSAADAELIECVDDTPTGAAAVKFAYLCPICFRHFAVIFVTRCCKHNICYGCINTHINMKMGGEEERMTLPCPTCNTEECDFDRVTGGIGARVYDESPKTKTLLARARDASNIRSTLAQYKPHTLARHRSDPYAIASQPAAASPPLILFETAKLKRFKSIPEHTNPAATLYGGVEPIMSEAPTAFTFGMQIRVAAT